MARALAYPDDRRKTARRARLSRGLRGLLIPQAVENLRAGEEDRSRAGEQQELAAIARIFVKISRTARHRADGEGINDQARFQASLDDEQASDLFQHHPQPKKAPCHRRTSGLRRARPTVNCKLIRDRKSTRLNSSH